MTQDSNYIDKGPCDACGSSDANARYNDGHTHCFACGVHGKSDGEARPPRERKRVAGLLNGEVLPLHSRKLTQATCEKFGYKQGEYRGQRVQIAPYYDRDGNLVAQHLRTQDKEFPWTGDPKDAAPFGYHAFQKSGRVLVVTEGEIDAMSVAQAQGLKWPVWSIGCGAGQGDATKVRKYIAERIDLFREFEKVVFMFDSDEPGRDSAKAAASVLGPKGHIASLPLKDASDMLKAGRVEELIDAMWRAPQYRPEGMVDLSTITVEQMLRHAEPGQSWGIPALDRMTYGRRRGELYAFGAGTGVGKSDILYQIIAHIVSDLKQPVGTFFFEAEPTEVKQRIAGKLAKKTFHVPDTGWTEADLSAASALLPENMLFAYDSYGVNEWAPVKERIEYLAHAYGVKDFFIDPLTALVAMEEDERKTLEQLMADLGGLVKKLDISIYFVSHLNTPEGKPHEEGGRVFIRHFKGSRALGFWSHFMFGLERDQQAEDENDRITTLLRCLKDRKTGRGTGMMAYMKYNFETGMLDETETSVPTSAEAAGFQTTAKGSKPSDF